MYGISDSRRFSPSEDEIDRVERAYLLPLRRSLTICLTMRENPAVDGRPGTFTLRDVFRRQISLLAGRAEPCYDIWLVVAAGIVARSTQRRGEELDEPSERVVGHAGGA
jgi:hypothetical protein